MSLPSISLQVKGALMKTEGGFCAQIKQNDCLSFKIAGSYGEYFAGEIDGGNCSLPSLIETIACKIHSYN
jgi:hypothetical protein